jgi:hypothetical protein
MPGFPTPTSRLRSLLACAIALACPAGWGQFGVRPDGSSLQALAPAQTRAVALFFVASDCPISDRTFPEMKRLRESFTAHGVRVFFVYPNTTENPGGIAVHQRAFDPGGEILLDPKGDLVRLTHARVTPEVSILLPAEGSWRPVYTGRIDDRFIHLGLERPRPTQIFAEDALDAALSGKPIPKATGTPVGCAIVNPAINGATVSR